MNHLELAIKAINGTLSYEEVEYLKENIEAVCEDASFAIFYEVANSQIDKFDPDLKKINQDLSDLEQDIKKYFDNWHQIGWREASKPIWEEINRIESEIVCCNMIPDYDENHIRYIAINFISTY